MTPEEIERVAIAISGAPFPHQLSIAKARRAIATVEQILRDSPLPDDLTELEAMYQHAMFEVQLISEKIAHVRLQMKRDDERAIADARREMTK